MKRIIYCILFVLCIFCVSCAESNNVPNDSSLDQGNKDVPSDDNKVVELSTKDNDTQLTGSKIESNDSLPDDINNAENNDAQSSRSEVTILNEEFLNNLYVFSEKSLSGITSADGKADAENLVYAPINYYLSLSMLGELADGEAKIEIQSAIGVSDMAKNSSELNAAISKLQSLSGKVPVARFNINNSLWLGRNDGSKAEAIKNQTGQYGTEVFTGSFNDSEYKKQMSDWVYDNTNKSFRPDYSNLFTGIYPHELIALNTLDYYGEWLKEFKADETKKGIFYSSNGEVTCDFMNMENDNSEFIDGDGYVSTNLWLKNGEMMIFILPDEDTSMDSLVNQRGTISGIIREYVNRRQSMGKVTLSVPKFSVTDEVDLKDAAIKMGITKVFDRNARAFASSIDSWAYLNGIKQSSTITVDEKGCSAASYTEMVALSSGVSDKEIVIDLNRPFIYVMVKDKIPYLMGVVANPM